MEWLTDRGMSTCALRKSLASDNPLVGWFLATGAPWYTGKGQIHGVLGVPFFAEHIRALTKRFDSKLLDVCVEYLSSAVS